MFSIVKKTANVWHHTSDTQTVHLSTFGVVADITAQTFIVRALNGAFFPRKAVSINDIQVIDETDIGTIETFANIDELLARLIQLQYPPYNTSGGGGGVGTIQEVLSQGNEIPSDTPIVFPDNGAFKSAYSNGEVRIEDTINGISTNFDINGIVSFITGLFSTKSTYLTFEEPTQVNEVVVPNESGTIATREWVEANPSEGLTADDITETATRFWLTNALKTAYDSAVAWISTVGAPHVSSTSNPHNVTKAQVGLGNVDNTSDLNKPISTATQTALNGKITQTAIQDISLTSTIVGWSTFTTRYIGVLDLGFAFLCIIDLRGVSNNATTSVSVPFANAGGTAQEQMRVENSGTFQNTPGLASIANGVSAISFFLNNQGGSFSNSGNKSVVGQILIYK